jgi:hypothetical protein
MPAPSVLDVKEQNGSPTIPGNFGVHQFIMQLLIICDYRQLSLRCLSLDFLMQITLNSVLGSGLQNSSSHHIIHFIIDHCNLFYCYTRGVWDASIHLSNRTTAHPVERCCFGHSITHTILSRSRSSNSFTGCDHFRSSSQETLSHFN